LKPLSFIPFPKISKIMSISATEIKALGGAIRICFSASGGNSSMRKANAVNHCLGGC